MKEVTMTCIVCPRGCKLHIDSEFNISGNFCPRGMNYAKSELTNPVRNISSTVRVNNRENLVIPVKTSNPIPKQKIFDVMKEINNVSVSAPLKIGQIIIKNVLNLGVDIIATKNID